MAQSLLSRLRLTAALALLLAAVLQSPSLAASSRSGGLPSCASACDAAASCSEECEEPWGDIWIFTTCGEYEGGYSEDQCDGSPAYSCTYNCDHESSPSQSCVYEGQSTTCGGFGVADSCGDGMCSPNESCSSCTPDCGACPNPGSSESQSWGQAALDAASYGHDFDSIQSGSAALNFFAAAGLIPYDDYEVDWADSGEPYGMDQCCDGWSPSPSPMPAASSAPSMEVSVGVEADEADKSGDPTAGLPESSSLTKGDLINPTAWTIGWYDCNVREGRLSFLRKVNKAVGWLAAGMATAATFLTGGAAQGAGATAAGAGGMTLELGDTISNIERLPCFPRMAS